MEEQNNSGSITNSIPVTVYVSGTTLSGSYTVSSFNANTAKVRLKVTVQDVYSKQVTGYSSFLAVDNIAPIDPVINSIDGKSSSPAIGKVNTPQVVISGVNISDSIEVYKDGILAATPQTASGSSITVTLDPLGIDKTYQITAKAVDLAGNVSSLSNPFSYQLDTTVPTITSRFPVSGATNVRVNDNVYIIFSEDTNSSTLNNTNIVISSVYPQVNSTITYDSTNKKVNLGANNFKYLTLYTVTVNSGVYDLAGNALSPTSWTFTTEPDIYPPKINPITSSVNVSLTSSLVFGFDEAVVDSTVSTAIYGNQIQLKQGTNVVAASVYYNTTTKQVTITPTSSLSYGTTYTVYVWGVTDALDNKANDINSAATWLFTTESQPSLTSPGGGGGLVAAVNTDEVTVKPGENTTISTGDIQITIPIGATNEKLTAKVTPLESKDTAYITIDKIANIFAEKIITAFDFTLAAEKGNVDIKRGMTISFKTGNIDKDYAFYRLDPVLNTLVPIKTLDRKDSIEATITQPGKLVVLEEKLPSFADIKTTSWSAPYIYGLAQKNVINGMSDGKFDPTANLTRGQLSKIITISSGIPGNNTSAGFNDVTSQAWSTPFINTAKSAGVINGYADGSFKPDKAVTRVELLKMVVTATGLKVEYEQGDFKDAKGHWAEKYIATATKAGIVGGYSDGSFKPDAPVTRAEAAKIIAIAGGYVKPAI
ncbi:MAG: S-layer homology domain-containing protein [Thermincolia bacterium]